MQPRMLMVVALALVLLVLGPASAPSAAQSPALAAPDSLASAKAAAYQRYKQHANSTLHEYDYAVSGNTLRPRTNAVTVGSIGHGCSYRASASGIAPDSDALASPVQLPTGAVILGLSISVYDTSSTADGYALLSLYDGSGGVHNLIGNSISGTPGYAEQYVALTTPFTVTNSTGALALVWYSDSTTPANSIAICAMRLHYAWDWTAERSQFALTTSSGSHDSVQRYAGANFQPTSSSATYTYGAGGCLSSSEGSYTIDVDVPSGSAVLGVHMQYYFTAAGGTGPVLHLTSSDGLGAQADLVSIGVDDTSLGYHSRYVPLTTPYTVNQAAQALHLDVDMALSAGSFCGASIIYRRSAAPFQPILVYSSATDRAVLTSATAISERFIGGSTFQPAATSAAKAYASGGCSYLTSGTSLSAAVNLPAGALLQSVTLYYSNTTATTAELRLTDYNGRIQERGLARSVTSANVAHTSSTGLVEARYAPYIVDNASYALAGIWQSSSPATANAVCGMRITSAVPIAYPTFLPVLRRQP